MALTLLGRLFLGPDTFRPTLTSPQLYWNIIGKFEIGHNILLSFFFVESLTCQTIDEFLFPCKWKSQMIRLVCIKNETKICITKTYWSVLTFTTCMTCKSFMRLKNENICNCALLRQKSKPMSITYYLQKVIKSSLSNSHGVSSGSGLKEDNNEE